MAQEPSFHSQCLKKLTANNRMLGKATTRNSQAKSGIRARFALRSNLGAIAGTTILTRSAMLDIENLGTAEIKTDCYGLAADELGGTSRRHARHDFQIATPHVDLYVGPQKERIFDNAIENSI
jgi:hypothetical protein